MRRVHCILVAMSILILLTGCYIKPEGIAGKVNDVEISEEQYLGAVRREYESFKLKHDKSPTSEQVMEIYDTAWDNLAQGIILESLYKEYGIYTTREEVMDSLRNHPPVFIRDASVFQSDHGFDNQLYLEALDTGEPVNLNWLKRHYFNSYIPFRKLQQKVLLNIPVDEDEVRKEYQIRNGSADVEIVHLKPENFARQVVSQPEVAAYYEAHRDSFLIPESCTLDYVAFHLVPSKADTLGAKVLIDSLYNELKAGAPFAATAAKFSDAESSLKNGDVGFVEIEKLPASVRKQLKKGDYQTITKPFFQDGCWKIYNPVAKTKTMVKIEEIAIVPRISSETRQQLYKKVTDFRELALQITLKRAASEYGMECGRLEELSYENDYVELFGALDTIIQQALRSNEGAIFPPQFNNKIESYVLFQVIEAQPRKTQPLVEVSDTIFDLLLRKKQLAAAAVAADEYLKKYKDKEMLAHAALDGYSRYTIEHFTFLTEVDGAWVEDLNRAILAEEEPGMLRHAIHSDYGSFLVVIDGIQPPPPYGYQSQKPFLEEDIVMRKRDAYFDQWLEEKVSEAKINDWHRDILKRKEEEKQQIKE